MPIIVKTANTLWLADGQDYVTKELEAEVKVKRCTM